jgi:hypothetical protein
MNNTIRRLTVAVAVIATVGATASVASAQVWGTATNMELVGSRSIADGGLVAGSPGYTGATVSWTIAAEGNLLRYTYTFSGLDPRNNVSHAIFALSEGCTLTNGCVTSVTGGTPELGTFRESQSNPGMPNSIFGVKINTTGESTTYSFLSNRVAVWGDIYLKGASDLHTYNTGLLTENRLSNNTDFFIARPDTEVFNVVPEPSTYAMMGMGMLGLVGVARRRRAQG